MERTSELMFLSQQDVVDLTGHSRAAIQMRWLRANAIPFLIGGDGQPKVARQTVLEKLDPSRADSEQKGAAMPCLAEITDNWDKVSEALMAELMGVTARALQGRRSRGVIPADVWREVDGRVMYSLSAMSSGWTVSGLLLRLLPLPSRGS
ncbi:DUF4224 domain-containing protein [Pseudomonas faucium]|uniref:DUF4224 domain-containing protein n=1 Tax=Pseudomonas faucium TaxID=2740518 RepID=UPI0039C2157A